MIRVLLLIVAACVVGCGLGFVQHQMANANVIERFSTTRATEDEILGRATQQELQEQMEGTPKVEIVGGTEHYFGMMQFGETMSHEFEVRNVGDGPLTLGLGKSSCTCTVGELNSSTIQPGESTKIKLTWTAKSQLREFGQYAMVITNDTKNLEVKLTVRGQIAKSFMLEPESIQLGTVDENQVIERDFYLFSYLEQSDTIEQLSWNNESLDGKFEATSEKTEVDLNEFPQHQNAKHASKISLKFGPGLPIGPLKGSVQIQTDLGAEVELIPIAVSGTVAGRMEILGGPSFEPKHNLVKLGNVKSDEGATATVILAVRGEDRDKLKIEVDSKLPEETLQVEVGEPKPSASRTTYKVKFVVPKGSPRANFPASGNGKAGIVVIKAIGENVQELPIKVRLVVMD